MQAAQPQAISNASSALTASLNHNTCKKPFKSLSSAHSTTASAADKSVKQQLAKPSWQHSPHAEGAIILNRAQWNIAGEAGAISPIVVDPHVGRHLRPHQIEGVQFMYECIMGGKEANRQALSAVD